MGSETTGTGAEDMPNLRSILLSIIFLCSATLGINSNGTGGGDFTAGASWNGGVAPVNGDTAVILNGDTITFDEDMSGWANGITLTINDGGTMICDTAAGDYYLMCQADLTLNGTLQAGTSTSVPLPSDVTFTIDFNGTAFSIQSSATGLIYFYAQHPTNKYVRLSGAEAAGQTILSVDTDVTGDSMWAAGAVVTLNDLTATVDKQETTIAATAAATITVNDVLDSDNVEGAYLVLISRNIKIIDTTDDAIKNLVNSWVECEFRDTDGLYVGSKNTFNYCTLSNNVYAAVAMQSCTFSDCCITNSNTTGFSSLTACVFTDCLLAGTNICFNTVRNSQMANCIIAGGSYGTYNSFNMQIQDCGFDTITSAIYTAISSTIGSCTFDSCVNALYQVSDSRFYNCDFSGATTEHSSYNSNYVAKNSYTSSEDHDQTENAFKAWAHGGVITSQTASPPAGYTIWYQFTAEDTTQTYSVFRQYETTVLPGTALEVEGLLRNDEAGLDLTGVEPFLAIADKFADPFVDSTQSYLDIDYIPDPDADSENGWQAVSVIWANQGDSPRQVIVRMVVEHDGGGDDVVVDGVWAIADYQDQIATLYNVLMPVKTDVAVSDSAISFTLTAGVATNSAYDNMTIMVQDADDDHWELRNISDWTSSRVVTVDTAFSFTPAVDDLAYIMGTSYGAPTDNDAIADAVWDEAMTGHTTETTFGGELQTLDPNITAILADTNELQTDWTDGGRLDSILDDINDVTSILEIINTTVSDANDANSFTITAGADVNDAYIGNTIYVQDADDGEGESRMIIEWTSGRVVTVEEPFGFTPANGDVVVIWKDYFPMRVYWEVPKRIPPDPIIIDQRASVSGGGIRTIDAEGDDP